MELNRNALTILKERYLMVREDGTQETPAEMWRRVAEAVAQAEAEEQRHQYAAEFYHLLSDLYFLPNTPTLSNAGRPQGQLAACFLLPVEDSIDGIFRSIHHAAVIHQTGGGTGFNFSHLREAGALVRSTGKAASGPVSFLRVFDAATEAINQGGVRRGANMGILRVDHPDIIAFINCKRAEGRIRNFNLSVGITDQFIQQVRQDQLTELVSPLSGKVVSRIPAQEILRELVDSAWATGEPGIVFLDTINRANTLARFGALEGTNPCGEQPLFPYESCILGSINLPRHLKEGTMDWERLRRTVALAVRFLDNCITVTHHPLPQIADMTLKTRKIGLGVMGWADLLLFLGLRYDSQEALDLAEELMSRVYLWADQTSRELAEERGVFPLAHLADETVAGRRNATLTTIAPTGTISLIAGVSSGIEPLFGFAQVSRRNIVDEPLFEINAAVLDYCRRQGVDLGPYWVTARELGEATRQLERLQGFLRDVLPAHFLTTYDIAPEWHLRTQAVFQRYVDNAVSKTINLPFEATKKDVEHIFLEAHAAGLKGVTVYRNGSREQQVIYTQEKRVVRPRPAVLNGRVFRVSHEDGSSAYVTVTLDDRNQPFEVFANSLETLTKPWNEEAIFRLASIALRAGVPASEIIRQLDKANSRWGGSMFTTPALIKRLLSEVTERNGTAGACPHCGGTIFRRGGCLSCPCGQSNRCE